MARNIETVHAAGLSAPVIMPVRMVMITFRSAVKYCWSGVGPLTWNGMTFLGIGSLGQVGGITEGVGVQASGTSLTLSGIDPVLLGECLTDIQVGAPAKIWRGLWNRTANTLLGTPYQIFRGQVDKPAFQISGTTLAITISLENRIVNLGRASFRRYTSADQHLSYPTDTGMGWMEMLNDIAIKTGL
jgi:hypothetical protein